ncbi:hypothetical protein BDK51DRAFT_46130 [Blyttiomyces helicus]|uniref:Uncharacterized protein n=1 Tax=Blyttiomyces helicus TaxID=388810 RepID=A0A4P9W6N4_9FUNG|nr:hypothetical protein BDK51DRAFT_46130 [Blyttiomyces helicus]|eukprot:RKO86608.1 hypothetical protein BDK51DRAFT_46130 [Blyttiomyces helicus]
MAAADSRPRQAGQVLKYLLISRRTAYAAFTRWLTLNPLPKLIAESPPQNRDPDAAGTAMSAPAPRAPGARSRWPQLPVELLGHFLRLRRAMERKPPSLVAGDEEDQLAVRITAARDKYACSLGVPRLGARGVLRALGVGGGHLGPVVREPRVRQLLLVHAARARHGASGGHPLPPFRITREMSLRTWFDAVANATCELLVVDFLPRANIVSPNLTALDLGSITHYAEVFALSEVDNVGLKGLSKGWNFSV